MPATGRPGGNDGDKREVTAAEVSSCYLSPVTIRIGQTPDLPATHARLATVAPFPVWRGSPALRCAEPEV